MGMKVFLTTPVSKDNTHGRWVLLPVRQERIGGYPQKNGLRNRAARVFCFG